MSSFLTAVRRAHWRMFPLREDGCLLIWQAADQWRMLTDAFVSREGEAESEQAPVALLQLLAAFHNEPRSGSALTKEHGDLYEEASRLPMDQRAPLSKAS